MTDRDELIERLNGENPDKMTPTDRLRLFATDPETFVFDSADAAELVEVIEEAIAALRAQPAGGKVRGLAVDGNQGWKPWEGADAIVDQDGNVLAWTVSGDEAKRRILSALEPADYSPAAETLTSPARVKADDSSAALSGQEAVAAGEANYQEYCRAQEAEFADEPADLSATLRMLERWGPEAFPANEQGQVHFGRAILDSAASAIRKHLASPVPAEPSAKGWRTQAAKDVLAERRRQVEAEGWTPEHDDAHSKGELAQAAACYADPTPVMSNRSMDPYRGVRSVPDRFPDSWTHGWWKPTTRRRNLVKAGALILAEIERLDRLPSAPKEG